MSQLTLGDARVRPFQTSYAAEFAPPFAAGACLRSPLRNQGLAEASTDLRAVYRSAFQRTGECAPGRTLPAQAPQLRLQSGPQHSLAGPRLHSGACCIKRTEALEALHFNTAKQGPCRAVAHSQLFKVNTNLSTAPGHIGASALPQHSIIHLLHKQPEARARGMHGAQEAVGRDAGAHEGADWR